MKIDMTLIPLALTLEKIPQEDRMFAARLLGLSPPGIDMHNWYFRSWLEDDGTLQVAHGYGYGTTRWHDINDVDLSTGEIRDG